MCFDEASSTTPEPAGRGPWPRWSPGLPATAPRAWILLVVPLVGVGCHYFAPVRASRTEPLTREVSGTGPYTWEADTGWKLTRQGKWGEPSQVRAEALEAFEAESYADALLGFEQVQDSLPGGDPALPETRFYLAECCYYLGRYRDAVENYRLVYRSGQAGETIMNRSFFRVYEIALDYLSGQAGVYLLLPGLKVKGAQEGITLLVHHQDGLITEYPYLPFADDALMEIARYHYEAEDYAEAESYYERVITDYPGREWRETAQFRVAMAVFLQIRGVEYDQEVLLRAERNFRRYLSENPRGERAEEARARLRELTEWQGQSYLQIARFYLRDSQVRAAKLYLRIILEKYTTTEAAEEAREISLQVERLESSGS